MEKEIRDELKKRGIALEDEIFYTGYDHLNETYGSVMLLKTAKELTDMLLNFLKDSGFID